MNNAEPETLLPPKRVAELFGVSTRTLWRWVSAGILPEPKRYTGSTVRWSLSDLQPMLQGGNRKKRERTTIGV